MFFLKNKNPRRIRLGNDGNLYLGDELVSTTTEKERSVLQELEESTTKLNSFISTNPSTSSRGGVGSVGVKSGNPVSGIRVSTEGGVGAAIDENASVSKQTIQALRYLFRAGRYYTAILIRPDRPLLCDISKLYYRLIY